MNTEPAKYAKPERERRFVLSEIPAAATDAQEILDLYIVGTRMRLRTVSSDDGIAYKLGQKVRPNPEEPGLVMHTTLYLSRSEYEVLAVLPCRRLRKTRRHVALADGPLSVDAFHDGLVGLILAEVDLGDQGEPGRMFDPPRYCVAEVSSDERFTGGRLAATDRAAMVEVLEAVSGLRLPA